MKIIHIDNAMVVTGAYKALLSWCLQHPEWEHVWILPRGSKMTDEVRRHYTCYEIPFVEISRSPANLLKYIPALLANAAKIRRIIQKEQPDVLHANDLYNLVFYPARKTAKGKLPVVVHVRMLRRSFPGKIYDFWKKIHLKSATAIIAVSKIIQSDWDNHPSVQLVYDPVFIDEKYPPYVFHKQDNEPFRFVYLANYIAGKGQADALAAIQELVKQGIHHFTVDFWGDTMGLEKNVQYKNTLIDFVKENQLEQYIVFHEKTEDVEQVLKSYHTLLHFSHSESFGMVCYEALSYGLPVISTACGGPEEMIRHGETGILVKVQDTTAMAAAMKNWIQAPHDCHDFSVKGKAFVQQQFQNRKELTDIFKEAAQALP